MLAQRRSAWELRRLQQTRPHEDIGTLAWALDRRASEFDPWVALRPRASAT